MKTKEQPSGETPSADPAPEADAKPEMGKMMSEKGKNPLAELYLGMAEKTQAVSPYVPDSMMRPYNPDDLYQRRQDYGIYEEMLRDDQVAICMQIKKDLVLGAGWDLVCEGDEEADTEVKEAVEVILREKIGDPDAGEADRGFDDMLEEVLSAYEFGFSLTEKVFKKLDDGSIGLKYLRTRHPATWLIHTDEYGTIEKYEQRVGAYNSGDLVIKNKSLIHYINKPKFQNPYGQSDLRVAYNAWFAKTQIIRYFSIFLEKSAGPIPVAKYKAGAPNEAVTEIYNAIKSFQQKTALAIPDAIEVEFLEAKNSGEAYEKAVHMFNMFIGRALFIPDLLGFQGAETGGGSYALGKDQIGIFFKHITRRRETLERLVNLHIVRPIVLYNHGDMDKYPKFRLRPLEDEQAIDLAKVWVEAVKGKLYKPNDEEINHFRKLCKFPEGDVQHDEPMVSVDPETGLPLQQRAGSFPPKPGDPSDDTETEDEAHPDEILANLKKLTARTYGGPGSGPQPGGGKGKGEDIISKASSKLEKAVAAEKEAISAITKMQSENPGGFYSDPRYIRAAKALKTASRNRQKAVRDAKAIISAHEAINTQSVEVKKKFSASSRYSAKVNFAAIESAMNHSLDQVKADTAPILRKVMDSLQSQLTTSKGEVTLHPENLEISEDILSELGAVLKERLRATYVEAQNQAAREIDPSRDYRAPLPAKKFMDFLDGESEMFTKDWGDTLTKTARVRAVQAIKDGEPLSAVFNDLDDEAMGAAEGSIDRFARTKFTEVMNRGRLEHFEGTGIVDAYEYSAILDDRTSDVCAELHGKVFKAGREPIPPLHFNCRSVLVPITKYEDWDADSDAGGMPIQKFIDENKGLGFSTR